MNFSKDPQFKKLQDRNSPIYEVVVCIIALNKDCSQVIASGTGIAIAPNLILTAKHVVDDFMALSNPKIENGILVVSDFNIWCVFISNNPDDKYHTYEVARVIKSPFSDFSLLHLHNFDRTGTSKKWGQVPLALKIPNVGDRIVGFGFSRSKVMLSKNNDGQVAIDIAHDPHVTVGEITAVFPERRDSSLLNFPCFQTNAKLEGGMSGGPIFNNSGSLIGINCSSLETNSEAEHISYGALLWPLMGSTVTQKEKFVSLFDLAKNKIISATGLEHIILSKSDSNIYFNVDYQT